jgi:hypothetical protein
VILGNNPATHLRLLEALVCPESMVLVNRLHCDNIATTDVPRQASLI